ncbi:hypothetical protein F0562_012718 [Nyssa sinensis]|uniref:SPX domain-containing protein n=1 Tax=Nyssa sinensis TaxID=561372 RepID=A0A5J4ZWC3_9ASTE|nr:hypothetical protein F0562_012718 [Nyssa sinensis]
MKNEDQARSPFGISLSDRPKWQQFLICSAGFFFGYLVNGICEEYVYNRLQFSYGWYFTFVQGFVYLVLIYFQGFTIKQMVNPWKTYVKLSGVLMGSHGLTKGSLAFLNYPAQIMFKSTKVLPVMIMGAFIPGLRRKYPAHEYVSALLLVVGLILFTLADANTSPNFNIIGVVMIIGALVMDSFLGNLQEAIFTMNPEDTQIEMLFCSTVVGLPFLIPPMILTGELFQAWNSCSQHPYIYGVLVFEAIATFIGQISVLSLIAIFGAATTALAITLLLSYLIFTKPMTEQHGSGLLLVAMGISMKLLPDNKATNRTPVSNAVTKYGKSSSKAEKKLVESGETQFSLFVDDHLSSQKKQEVLKSHFSNQEMVAFGKKLKERQIQEWQGYYINYKLMKKKVKQYAHQIEVGALDRRHVLKDFSRMLDNQIEKIVLFLLEQQGLLASRIAKLAEEQDSLQQQPDISKLSNLREAYRAVGQDLLKLLFFVEMNAIGLRKILKKFDKRFGYRFTDDYVKTRANHPYSQLQQVFKHVGLGAVVGSISRNLADLQERQGSYLSIYDQPSLSLQDPIVDSIKAAVDRLTHSTNFLNFLAQHALIMQEELPTPDEEHVDDQRYHFMSLLLNLVNTFLYMVNTYIIVPTADDYSLSLGAAATVCGIVIGAMAVAQVFSSVYFSAWSNKSYFRPLIFSSIVLFVGNILYALAYDLNSIWVLLIGRLFCGFGSARAVNRRYISDCVPLNTRMQASAAFVSASALGMACGPALAGLLQTNFKIYMITINQNTLPGWVMAVAWLLYLLWLWISFKEPSHEIKENNAYHGSNADTTENDVLEKGLAQPLLLSSEDNEQDEDGDQELDGSEEAPEESRQPTASIGSAYRLLTPSVKVQLLIYFMLKFAMEILLSESSVITSYYFGWSTSAVAIFLACLGLTVLPVNIFVGSYISNMFEDRQILLASEIMVLVGIILSFHLMIPYSVPQYVCSGLIMFVSAEVLEGVNLSLLSRVMSSRLSRGTYNGGLLSTEAGTIARVIADGTITLAGYLGNSKLLNATLLPSLLICIASIIATCWTYNSLY